MITTAPRDLLHSLISAPEGSAFADENYGNTPLHFAASYGASYEVITSLIRKDPSWLTKQNDVGKIPRECLHEAFLEVRSINLMRRSDFEIFQELGIPHSISTEQTEPEGEDSLTERQVGFRINSDSMEEKSSPKPLKAKRHVRRTEQEVEPKGHATSHPPLRSIEFARDKLATAEDMVRSHSDECSQDEIARLNGQISQLKRALEEQRQRNAEKSLRELSGLFSALELTLSDLKKCCLLGDSGSRRGSSSALVPRKKKKLRLVCPRRRKSYK